MAYKEPMPWEKWEGRVFTGTGQELELLDTSDPRYVKYSKSFSRVWARNGDLIEFIIRVNGTIEEIAVTGKAVCGVNEVQPFYLKGRIEQPCEKAPTDPAIEALRAEAL